MLKAAKNHFFKHYLAPKHVCFQSKVMIKRSNPSALIYTCARHLPHITLRFGAFYPAFWCILPCVLVHFTLRFGAFYPAFCCVLHRVLVLNGVCFAAFYPAFWRILPQIMLRKALNGAQIVCLNNVQWLFIRLCTCLVLPQTSWRNTRKNVSEQRIGWKNCSHNVKFRAQNVTFPCRCFRQHGITTQ